MNDAVEENMKSRLIRFLIVSGILLAGLELMVRANGKYFFALSDKMLLKAEILERSPETRVLFLGTSRFLDAIDHEAFSGELKKRTGRRIKSLNAATAGLQSERLAYFAEKAVEHPGLTHIIIEASPPAMGKGGPLELPGAKAADAKESSQDKVQRFADRIEGNLQEALVDRVALVNYRKALRPKTLVKLFVLYTADYFDPNIWSRKRPLEAIFFPRTVEIDEKWIESFQPVVMKKGPKERSAERSPPDSEEYRRIREIARIFEGSGREVIWVAPPVSGRAVRGSHNRRLTRIYEAVAGEFDQDFLDYAGLGIEEIYLRDATHLNAKGRNAFSKILAAHLETYFPGELPQP